jgi:hypothetical protein
MIMNISKLPKNFTDTEVVTFNSLEELGNIITSTNYSGGLFRNNYTKNDNFISTSVFILDYDNSPGTPEMTLDDAINKVFKDYKCLIATTRNHRRAKTAGTKTLPAVDRFRVILFLDKDITNVEDFYATFGDLSRRFPGADEACKDPARRLFASVEVRYKNENGLLITPTLNRKQSTVTRGATAIVSGEKGIISKATREFMKNGAPAGSWNPALYKAARDYLEQGYTKEEFIEQAEKITGYLDYCDLSTIRSAFSKAPKYPPRILPSLTSAGAMELWVRGWIDENNIELSYKTGLMKMNGKEIEPDTLVTTAYLNNLAWAENNPILTLEGKTVKRRPYSQADIEHVMKLWITEQQSSVIPVYRDLIEFNPMSLDEGNKAIENFIVAVTGTPNKVDIAIMKHFIWQVKRKMNSLHIDWHLMPIFYGDSGSGKTRAISELLRPLNELSYFAPSMSVLDDSRESSVFSKFFIIFMDEMAKAERTNVESIKNKITSETISYRKLGTNINCTIRNNATFIAATNSDLLDLIYDPTSARRFWQIKTLKRCDWSLINSINYLAMWQCVNEQIDSNIKEYLPIIQEVQENELRVKSPIELWLIDYRDSFKPKIVNTSDDKSKSEELMDGDRKVDEESLYNVSFLYDEFVTWAERQKFKHFPTMNKFGRELTNLGVYKTRRRNGWYYEINPSDKKVDNIVPFKKE